MVPRIYLLICAQLMGYSAFACNCAGELNAVDFSVCSGYDVIFKGQVSEVQNCQDQVQVISLEIDRLYKGEVDRAVNVKSVCTTECSVHFEEGDVWLFFVDKNNAQDLVYDPCSFSRRLPTEGQKDYEEEVRGSSYFEDESFLEENFEANAYYKIGLKARKYEKVDPKLIPVFLGVSLVFMVVGYFLFNYFSKKQKK